MERGGLVLAHASAVVFTASTASALVALSAAYLVSEELGGGLLAAGALTSAFMAGRALSSTLSGFLGDLAPGLLPVMPAFSLPLSGLAIASIPALGHAFGVAGVMAAYAAWGVFNGMAWPPLQVLVASNPWRGRPSTSLSIYFAAGNLGFSLGYALYGRLPGGWPVYEAAGAAYAAAGLSLTILAGRLRGALRRPARRGGAGRIARVAGVILFAAFVAGAVQGLSREYLYVFLGKYRGLDKSALSASLSTASLAAVAALVAAGLLADAFGVLKALSLDLALMAFGLAAVAAPLPAVVGVSLLYFAVRSSMPLVRNASVVAGSGFEARLVGLANTVGNLGAVVAPPLAGAIAESGVQVPGLPAGALPLLAFSAFALAGALVVLRESRATTPTPP